MQKRGKRGKRSAPQSRIPSLERIEGQTDGEATKKGRPARGKGYPFFSPDEKKRGCRGARDNREDGGEEKRRDVIRG